MPRVLRTCSQPGCPELVKAGRCAKHTRKDTRPSARKRGYNAYWERIRLQVLAEEPGCQVCGSPDDPHVDHIDGNPFNYERSNLRRLCHSHHSARTARDQRTGPGWQRHERPAPVFG